MTTSSNHHHPIDSHDPLDSLSIDQLLTGIARLAGLASPPGIPGLAGNCHLPDIPSLPGLSDLSDLPGLSGLSGLSGLLPPAPPTSPRPDRPLQGTSYLDLHTRPLRWLWQDRIPFGKLSLLDGDPATGKSLLSLDLAARFSSGRPLPGNPASIPTDPGTVVLVSLEDDPADTVKPRLAAAGADFSHLHSLTTIPTRLTGGIADVSIRFPTDLHHLATTILKTHARFVIIDPLLAALSPRLNASREQSMRQLLSLLAFIADETGCAILLVRHLSRSRSANPLYRGTGALSLITSARSALFVLPDPSDADTRLLAVSKANLAVPPEHLAFRIASAPDGQPLIHWLEPSLSPTTPTTPTSMHAPLASTHIPLATLLRPSLRAALSPQRQHIIGALEASPEPLGPQTLADLTGQHYNNIRPLLSRMAAAGQIISPSNGLYAPLPPLTPPPAVPPTPPAPPATETAGDPLPCGARSAATPVGARFIAPLGRGGANPSVRTLHAPTPSATPAPLTPSATLATPAILTSTHQSEPTPDVAPTTPATLARPRLPNSTPDVPPTTSATLTTSTTSATLTSSLQPDPTPDVASTSSATLTTPTPLRQDAATPDVPSTPSTPSTPSATSAPLTSSRQPDPTPDVPPTTSATLTTPATFRQHAATTDVPPTPPTTSTTQTTSRQPNSTPNVASTPSATLTTPRPLHQDAATPDKSPTTPATFAPFFQPEPTPDVPPTTSATSTTFHPPDPPPDVSSTPTTPATFRQDAAILAIPPTTSTTSATLTSSLQPEPTPDVASTHSALLASPCQPNLTPAGPPTTSTTSTTSATPTTYTPARHPDSPSALTCLLDTIRCLLHCFFTSPLLHWTFSPARHGCPICDTWVTRDHLLLHPPALALFDTLASHPPHPNESRTAWLARLHVP